MSCHLYLQSAMRDRGLRMTRQRRTVLEVIHQCRQPVTAAQILHLVHAADPRTDGTTVYRTLNFLEAFGLISAYDTANGGRRYQHAGDDGRPHLVCRRCGRTSEIAESEITNILHRIGKVNDFDVHPASVVIPGVCRACRKKRK